VAGQMRGVGVVFSRFLEVPVELGVVIGMVIVAFYAVLGGMKGVTYTQIAQYCVLIFAYLVPAIAIALLLTGNPVPQIAIEDILPRLDAISVDLGLTGYSSPFTDLSSSTSCSSPSR
jgi:cation/acetate symporter